MSGERHLWIGAVDWPAWFETMLKAPDEWIDFRVSPALEFVQFSSFRVKR